MPAELIASEVITTRTSRLWLRPDGIVHVQDLPGLLKTLDDAKESIEATARLAKGKALPVLVDMRAGLGATRETRAYYSSEENLAVTRALALLVGSRLTRTMANLFISVNRPPIPTRLFTSEDDAVAWLKTFS